MTLQFRRQMARLSGAEALRAHESFFLRFGEAIAANGFPGATHFYSVMHEAGPALAAAKARGLKIGVDVCIAPSWPNLLNEEYDRHPNWGKRRTLFSDAFDASFRPYRFMFENADVFVCPSKFVQHDLVQNHGVSPQRTALVPYGIPGGWFNLAPRTEVGRILFAGTAEVRKGIHHFARAADLLTKKSSQLKFVVAGEVDVEIREHPEAAALTFLGRIPRAAIADEFSRADVLVLPSIAEGSAGVTYEAMAAGLPQVVTHAAGSGVRDGIDGIVLPVADPEDIANAIEYIVGNRLRRAQMAASARDFAHRFSWSHFGANLRATFLS